MYVYLYICFSHHTGRFFTFIYFRVQQIVIDGIDCTIDYIDCIDYIGCINCIECIDYIDGSDCIDSLGS